MSQVRFCPECDNNFTNYQLETTEGGEYVLKYLCKTCFYTEKVPQVEDLGQATVYQKINLNSRPDRPLHEDICDDATLAHTSTVPCPKKDCPSHKNKNYDLAMIDYNDDRKIAYICCICKSTWKVE